MSANKSKRWIPVLILAVMALSLNLARADDLSNGVSTLRQTSRAFTAIAKQAIPAVVFIEVEKIVETDEDYPRRFHFNDPFDMFGEDFFDILAEFLGDDSSSDLGRVGRHVGLKLL